MLPLIFVTDFGILNNPSISLFNRFNPIQLLNALLPIDSTLFGNIIDSILFQSLNAFEGIVISFVIVTSVIDDIFVFPNI